MTTMPIRFPDWQNQCVAGADTGSSRPWAPALEWGLVWPQAGMGIGQFCKRGGHIYLNLYSL